MILSLFLWITRQKGAREGAWWPSAAGPIGPSWPPQTVGQGRATAAPHQRARPPLVFRHVTVNSSPPNGHKSPRILVRRM